MDKVAKTANENGEANAEELSPGAKVGLAVARKMRELIDEHEAKYHGVRCRLNDDKQQ